MRLRDNVRPPERYNADEFYAPFTPKSTRERRSQRVPTYVDYNPNLPPAAFPTLDRPRVMGPYADRSGKENNGDGGTIRGDNRGTSADNKIESVLTDRRNDYLARHGIGRRDHMDDATSGPRWGHKDWDDMSRSSFDEYMMEPETSFHDLDWSHIAPQLQVEIFSNLLQHDDWPTVCRMLGVIEQEEPLVKESLKVREAQISLENQCMKDMRQRQLNALLRRDNSAKHKEMHEELLFRKISRQSTRMFIGRLGIDYFSCRESDVTKANLFVRKRGLDPWIVGEWSNGIIGFASQSASIPENDDKVSGIMDERRPAMESTETAAAISPPELEPCMGTSTPPARSQPLHQSLHAPLPERRGSARSPRVVRLKIGAQRAAQVGNLEPAGVQPDRLDVDPSPLDCRYRDLTCEMTARTSEPHKVAASISPQATSLATGNTSGPLCRTFGQTWSCNSAEPTLEPLSSSIRLRERLEAVRLEVQRQRQQAQWIRDSGSCNPFSQDLREPIPGVQSPPASPVQLMSEDGIDEFYESDNGPYSVSNVNTHDRSSYTPNSSDKASDEMSGRDSAYTAYTPLSPPISAIRPSFTPPTPASDDRYGYYLPDEGDCGYEEDGMIWL